MVIYTWMIIAPSPVERMDPEQFFRIAKALADPTRFEIFQRIACGGEVGCQRLVGELPVSQPTVSHHLKELSVAGLIEPRREGQFIHYRPRPGVFEAYVETLRSRVGGEQRA